MLLQMTFSGSLLIAVTVMLRQSLLSKLPKATFLALWMVALVRLLIPFTVPFQFSIYGVGHWLSLSPPDTPVTMMDGTEQGLTEIIGGGLSATPGSVLGGVATEQTAGLSGWQIIWLMGCGVMAIFFARAYGQTSRKLSTALPLKHSSFVEHWQQENLPLYGRTVRVLQSDQLTAPVSIGVLRPRILFPANMDLEDELTLKYVLTHELEHLRHLDTLWKLIAIAALCLHWFNPLVWLLFVLLNRDLELACDERVLRRFGEAEREPYALSLITMAETGSSFTPLYNSFSKHSAEERITTIMRYKKVSGAAAAVAVLLVLATASVFATSPIAQRQTTVPGQTHLVSAEEPDFQDLASQYEKYKEYGMTYDERTDELYYHGQLVRYFEDSYPVGDHGQAGTWHFTREGVVDVSGVRDFSGIVIRPDGSYDPSGELIGLQAASAEAFAARDGEELMAPVAVSPVSTSVTTEEGNTIEKYPYEEYEQYGLVYNEDVQRLYYDGKLVRYFEDILQTGPSTYKRFMKSTNRDGEIDLHCIYDEEGNLAGVQPFGEEEFAAKTMELKERF